MSIKWSRRNRGAVGTIRGHARYEIRPSEFDDDQGMINPGESPRKRRRRLRRMRLQYLSMDVRYDGAFLCAAPNITEAMRMAQDHQNLMGYIPVRSVDQVLADMPPIDRVLQRVRLETDLARMRVGHMLEVGDIAPEFVPKEPVEGIDSDYMNLLDEIFEMMSAEAEAEYREEMERLEEELRERMEREGVVDAADGSPADANQVIDMSGFTRQIERMFAAQRTARARAAVRSWKAAVRPPISERARGTVGFQLRNSRVNRHRSSAKTPRHRQGKRTARELRRMWRRELGIGDFNAMRRSWPETLWEAHRAEMRALGLSPT